MTLPADIAIRVTGLSKMFRVYKKPRDMFMEFMTGRPRHRQFWALRNISFEIKKGQVLGIIGRNGAGKSTLLKILAGTLDKTGGEIKMSGPVASILELGTGFHGEYSGRENIYLGGMMIGLSPKEIECKVDDIIDFSELRDVIDQPFKTYSTGMQARLTFATAVSVEPEIFIIDEALAVGDAKFQKKCFAKFIELSKKSKTILFVSHDTNSINYLCDQAILLEHGEILSMDSPKETTCLYHKLLFESEQYVSGTEGNAFESAMASPVSPEPIKANEVRYGDKKAEIIDFGITDSSSRRTNIVKTGEHYTIFFVIRYNDDLANLTLGCRLQTIKGFDVFAANTSFHKIVVPGQKRGDMLHCQFDVEMNLAPGDFFLTFGVRSIDADTFHDRRIDALHIKVIGDNTMDSACVVNLREKISVRTIAQGSVLQSSAYFI